MGWPITKFFNTDDEEVIRNMKKEKCHRSVVRYGEFYIHGRTSGGDVELPTDC